ncbi:trna-dihydrouridine synthase a [Nannochloropsis gaditana]|uniref:Trna-dihydrouridine synthase a n=1 Tax=Nannochloropsis gaditana TaxID=72520 RepID=W7TR33_9STRA|nr:trna-dihydrouridine synthase a [Nannochloropsis gaditana]
MAACDGEEDRHARQLDILPVSFRDAFDESCGNLKPAHTLSIAPMMEWTDRHYRYMMRGLTRHTQLYTEMIVDSTLLHRREDLDIFLGHDECEHPLAVQLGGSDPVQVGEAAALCEAYGGFNEINLNVRYASR